MRCAIHDETSKAGAAVTDEAGDVRCNPASLNSSLALADSETRACSGAVSQNFSFFCTIYSRAGHYGPMPAFFDLRIQCAYTASQHGGVCNVWRSELFSSASCADP